MAFPQRLLLSRLFHRIGERRSNPSDGRLILEWPRTHLPAKGTFQELRYTHNNMEEEKPGARTGSLLLLLFSKLRSIPHQTI
jgi:hypothetical protein